MVKEKIELLAAGLHRMGDTILNFNFYANDPL